MTANARIDTERIDEIESRVKQNIRNTGRSPYPESPYGYILDLVDEIRASWREIEELSAASSQAPAENEQHDDKESGWDDGRS